METSRGPPRVKNKSASTQQISAEQILREAFERQEPGLQAPTQRFADLEELHEFQGRKRKEFEDYVRRNRINTNNWMRYAQWELEQKEYARARSVFERALAVDARSVVLWLRYIEAEMRARNINHARNLLDRAVTVLPRVDKLWYKYVYMEETLGNVAGTRQVFERWMAWEPDEAAWAAYVKLERRYGEPERARAVFGRFTQVHPQPRNWIKWARFEEECGGADDVRAVFTTAIDTLGDDFVDEKLFIAYARYEAKLKEYERARVIYRYALDRLPRARSQLLHKAYTAFEKQFGEREGVEHVILARRRVQYEALVQQNPRNYDAWFDYARLEETLGDAARVRDVYERAVANLPPTREKRHWRRYIYLWILYALWEEAEAGDVPRTRQIYAECLRLVPHRHFTFAKLWLLAAAFEVRQLDLPAARRTLGRALGLCPKDKLFRGYIELETKLHDFSRCRTLFEKHLEFNPANAATWIRFAELEMALDDDDRARAIFELAIAQDALDMPELVWKAYIDFEEESGHFARTRRLFERLLRKTDHVKVWIAYAHFEINADAGDEPDGNDAAEGVSAGGEKASGEDGGDGGDGEDGGDGGGGRGGGGSGDGGDGEDGDETVSEAAKARARAVFTRAYQSLKDRDLKEERVVLLNAWKSFETTHGSAEHRAAVDRQMPRRVKKRRKLDDDSYEEYMDYLFPADEHANAGLLKLVQAAHAWRMASQAP